MNVPICSKCMLSFDVAEAVHSACPRCGTGWNPPPPQPEVPVEERLRRLEAQVEGLDRSRWWTQFALWCVIVVAIGHVVASRFFVLPWQRVGHYDRVVANRFEVPNQISSQYEFYHNTHDRPDAVFGWVSPRELEYGSWGGRDSERADIKRGHGPGLYIRTPRNRDSKDKEDEKLGVLHGVVSVPSRGRAP
jgi:hypothetical protein